jgi:predicted permease
VNRGLAERVHDVVLWCYPPSFRRAHTRDMRQYVRTAVARQGSPRVLASILADAIPSLAREWREVLVSRRRPPATWSETPHGAEAMHNLLRDVRYGVRLLAKTPSFTAAAVVTLALGIGVTVAIWSAVDATLLRPLPVADPGRLVEWSWTSSYPDYVDYRERSGLFAGVAAFSNQPSLSVRIGDEPELTSGQFVTGNYFDVLGVPMSLGRAFQPVDDLPGAATHVVISHGFWQRRLGGAADVIGRAVTINRHPSTIVGVAPRGFRGTTLAAAPDLWLPIGSVPAVSTGLLARLSVLERRGIVWLRVIGRLQPSAGVAEAEAAMDAVYRTTRPPSPGATPERLQLHPLTATAIGMQRIGDLRRFLFLLGALAVSALLIACVNVAQMLLARAELRRKEIAVRLALGAGRARVARQLLIESSVLAVLAAGAALMVASWTLRALGGFELPGTVPVDDLQLGLNAAAVTATLALSVVTAVLFGSAPAARMARSSLAGVLRTDTNGSSRPALRKTLVAAQVALCVVLLAGGGLFLRGVRSALAIDPGFDVHRVGTVTANAGVERVTVAESFTFLESALGRLEKLPGVERAAWSMNMPYRGRWTNSAEFDGYMPAAGEDTSVALNYVSPGYFETYGIPLRLGRGLEDASPGGPFVAVINEAAERRYFAGRPAVGGRVRLGGRSAGGASQPAWIEVTGVVADVRSAGLERPEAPMIYLPIAQSQARNDGDMVALERLHLSFRSSAPDQLLPAVVRELRAADPRIPLFDAATMQERVAGLVMPQRLGLTLAGVLGLVAVVLAGIGIYALCAYGVAARTREIGIRMALGAGRGTVVGLVVRDGIVPVAAGLLAGLAVALLAAPAARAFLYGVPPRDPLTFAGVSAAIAVTGLVAVWLPARRASRLEPARILRRE